MALPRPSVPLDWPAQIAAEAVKEMNAVISVFEPGIAGVYDPESDAHVGGTEPTLLFSSIARVQHFRSTVDAYDINQWVTHVNVRLQIPLGAETERVRKGLIVRVDEGGRDTRLTEVSLVVESAINSSHAAVRTITCVSSLNTTPPI